MKILPLLVALVVLPSLSTHATEDTLIRKNLCDLNHFACTRHLAGMTVILDIEPKPVRAMQDLVFTVTVSGGELSTARASYIDLGMPGMYMGPNRVYLTPKTDKTYQGKGFIVRCPSGRRTWKATVTLPDVGVADFVFDVVY